MPAKKSKLIEIEGSLVPVVHHQRVEQARADAVEEQDLTQISHLFKALADPSRLKLVMALRGGEMCVYDLAAFLGLSESAVSHQLRRLKEQSLVKSRRDGQVLFYCLDDDHISQLLNIGLDHVQE